ncbi:MAG: hypothetical protein Tsb002_31850 [Wenzhouxiangellaceae bacterium]
MSLAIHTKTLIRISLLCLILFSWPSSAATQWVRFHVPTMDCHGCSKQVRLTLLRVAGVKSVRVNERKAEVRIHYDDEITLISDLEAAIAEAGFMSSVSGGSQ